MRTGSRFAPEFKRSNLGEPGSDPDGQINVPHSLAVAQQRYQRRMAMYVNFIKCDDLRMGSMLCARTIERERHWTIRQHREVAIDKRKCSALFYSSRQYAD